MNDNKIQIIKDDEIDLRALFQVLWNDRKRIIQITGVVILFWSASSTIRNLITIINSINLFNITLMPSSQ